MNKSIMISMEDELTSWINKARAEGHSNEEIKSYLIEHGYDKDSVKSYFNTKNPIWLIGMILVGVIMVFLIFILFTLL